MPRPTRSNELLNLVDGLFYIEQDVIDLAANFYNELRNVATTFSDEAIEKLVPHITLLMSKLNDLTKQNNDLNHQIDTLREDLSLAHMRCADLNNSFKGISQERCEIEDMYEADARRLQSELQKCKQDNVMLQEQIDANMNSETALIVAGCKEKIASLTAERACLLTSIEVMEADMKCLRAELRSLESREKKRKRSVSEALLSELAVAEAALGNSSPAPVTTTQPPVVSAAVSFPSGPTPTPSATYTSLPSSDPPLFKDVLIIGDSHLRYSSKPCLAKGAFVECCPGGKITDIKNVLLGYVGVSLSVIYFHVGCNNLRRGYRGGPGYNGGHGKREALHSMADLLYSARTQFPDAKMFLNSVLIRKDISYKSLFHFNSQLELMCNNFNVEFVEANCCVGREDLSRDGVHFSRRGVSRLGSLFVDVVTEALRPPSADSPPADPQSAGHDSAGN